MRKYSFLALAALALVAFPAAVSFAAYGDYAYQTSPNTSSQYCTSACPNAQGCKWVTIYSAPDQGIGAGPAGTPVMVCPAPCCPADEALTCGAFCAAGQVSPGWPYGWCDEYWLRPNSNY